MASAVVQPSVDAIVRAIRDDNLYLDIEPTALAYGQWQLWLDDKRGNGVQALVFPSREAATAFEAEVAVALKAAYAAEVRDGTFPGPDESYHLATEVAETLGIYGSPT